MRLVTVEVTVAVPNVEAEDRLRDEIESGRGLVLSAGLVSWRALHGAWGSTPPKVVCVETVLREREG